MLFWFQSSTMRAVWDFSNFTILASKRLLYHSVDVLNTNIAEVLKEFLLFPFKILVNKLVDTG